MKTCVRHLVFDAHIALIKHATSHSFKTWRAFPPLALLCFAICFFAPTSDRYPRPFGLLFVLPALVVTYLFIKTTFTMTSLIGFLVFLS